MMAFLPSGGEWRDSWVDLNVAFDVLNASRESKRRSGAQPETTIGKCNLVKLKTQT
jgi:hypothetical protein